jgi:type I restriction enzyme S subunit
MTALLDAKRTFKRGLSQRLLSGQKRFPKFQSCRWKATALGDVVTCNLRKVPKPSGTFLSAGVRSHGKGVFLKEEFHSDQIALDELFEIKQGDLVVNITFGWEGAVAIVPPEADGALVSHRFPTYVVDQRKVLIEYLRHVIRARRFVFEVAVASPGGAGRNRVLNRSAFLQIPILLPGIEEQQEIASILNSCDKEIDLLERLRGQVGMHKRAFLSRLLSGELFIPTA